MTSEEQARLEMLRAGPCVPPEYLKDFLGLDWPMPGLADRDFHRQTASKRSRVSCPEGAVSRYQVESFLQNNRLVTPKWMAASLGMEEKSLERLLPLLPEIGLSRDYRVYPSLLTESLRADLTLNLRGLRYQVFSEREPYCKHLHDALHEAFDIEIEPLFCATSLERKEKIKRYADHFDSITLKPLSLYHGVWLDFGKPIALPPDRCSKQFYADNLEAEFRTVVGWREPDDLIHYRRQESVSHDV